MAKKKDVKGNSAVVEIEVKGDEWQQALDETFKKKQKEVKVDGYRKGKVPRNIYEKKFGKESLFIDAADSVLQIAFMNALKETDVEPIIRPEVELLELDENHVKYRFTIVGRPEVKLGKYTGLKVKKEDTKVTKKEVDEAVQNTLDRYAELVVKTGKIENGDTAIIDFEGSKDGVPFEGGKSENYSLEIGSNTFIPGFEEGLIGLKSGDEKDLKLKFPDEYPSEELKGQEVVFKVKVNEVKTKEQRKLDKDFFEDLALPGVDSKETLEEELKKNIEAKKISEANKKYEDDLLEAILATTEVEVPEQLVHEEIHRMMHNFEEQLKMQGLNLDMYYKFTNSDEEALHGQMHDEAEKNIKYSLMMDAIAKEEKIEVSDKELDDEINKQATDYKMEVEKIEEIYGGREGLRYELVMRKLVDFLKEKNS